MIPAMISRMVNCLGVKPRLRLRLRASCFCFNDVTCRHRLPNRVLIHSDHSLHRPDFGLSQPSPALSLSLIPEDHKTETEHYMTRSSPFYFPIRFEPTVGHECSLTHDGLSVSTPHLAHSLVVPCGSTCTTWVPCMSPLPCIVL